MFFQELLLEINHQLRGSTLIRVLDLSFLKRVRTKDHRIEQRGFAAASLTKTEYKRLTFDDIFDGFVEFLVHYLDDLDQFVEFQFKSA